MSDPNDIREDTIIIPAGGDQERWNKTIPLSLKGMPKQYMAINSMPLIEYTAHCINMCKNPEGFHVLAYHPFFKASFNDDVVYMPEEHSCLCESIRETYMEWNGDVYILIGDVIFSRKALEIIFNQVDSYDGVQFYGRTHEIYACCIPESAYEHAIYALETVIASFKRGVGRGKLWEFYRICANLDILEHEEGKHKSFTHINDYTQDFDLYEQYKYFADEIANKQIDLTV